jgi:seryl-tRNA synthetase
MHNIKLIKKDPEQYVKKFLDRNINFNFKNILELDIKNRDLILKKEKLEQEKKVISKKNDKALFSKSKQLSKEIEKLDKTQIETKNKIDKILSALPNIALNDVPVGKTEQANKVVRQHGIIPSFKFNPLTHYEIGKNLNSMDFDIAAKTSGARFVFLKNKLALLERAISNFMLDIHTKEFGYTEISPPLIVTDNTMFGTGQLPKFEDDQFEIILENEKNRKFLIPTAEVILTNIVKQSILHNNSLPLRLVASTPCFRKEAGSYGKDTKGMIRQHQFYKVELVSIVDPKNCISELERMTNCAEEILKKLKIPYRVVLLSTGDMGFSSEKTFDLEVWMPSEKKYREISSCSSCGQFQSRRMQARFKNEKNETDFLGTLNGSGLAIGRTLIAIMENYQQIDGSIKIPEVLIPYMHQEKVIA